MVWFPGFCSKTPYIYGFLAYLSELSERLLTRFESSESPLNKTQFSALRLCIFFFFQSTCFMTEIMNTVGWGGGVEWKLWKELCLSLEGKGHKVDDVCRERQQHKRSTGSGSTWGASLLVQWLRPCTWTAGGSGSIAGWETKIPYVARCGKKNKNKTKTKKKESTWCLVNGWCG